MQVGFATIIQECRESLPLRRAMRRNACSSCEPVMSITAWLFFLPACFAINLAPGPNNLLSINVAARHGFITAFVGGTGRLVAFALMLVLAATGLAVVLHASEWFFLAIKLVGAAYLIWLAIQLWRSDAPRHSRTRHRSDGLHVVSFSWPPAIRRRFSCLPRSYRNSSISRSRYCRSSPCWARAFSCSSGSRSRCIRGPGCILGNGWYGLRFVGGLIVAAERFWRGLG